MWSLSDVGGWIVHLPFLGFVFIVLPLGLLALWVLIVIALAVKRKMDAPKAYLAFRRGLSSDEED